MQYIHQDDYNLNEVGYVYIYPAEDKPLVSWSNYPYFPSGKLCVMDQLFLHPYCYVMEHFCPTLDNIF